MSEAKAHLSESVRQVAASGQAVAISVRGRPKVSIRIRGFSTPC